MSPTGLVLPRCKAHGVGAAGPNVGLTASPGPSSTGGWAGWQHCGGGPARLSREGQVTWLLSMASCWDTWALPGGLQRLVLRARPPTHVMVAILLGQVCPLLKLIRVKRVGDLVKKTPRGIVYRREKVLDSRVSTKVCSGGSCSFPTLWLS